MRELRKLVYKKQNFPDNTNFLGHRTPYLITCESAQRKPQITKSCSY